MTRAELAHFWDEQLALWFRGEALSPELEAWRLAYAGELQKWAFPEPYIGNLLGSPRIVLLANNPGIAHEELQSRTGAFAAPIKTQGFTAWAATRPYEGRASEWEKLHGPIPHNKHRLDFARKFLGDPSVKFSNLLNVELYPWHSLSLKSAIRVQPDTLQDFILEPLSELDREVPVIALGKAWAEALDRAPEVVETCEHFAEFFVASRRARLYTIVGENRIFVVWHSGSDRPPANPDIPRLRAIWFGDENGSREDAPEVKKLNSPRPERQFAQRPAAPRTSVARPRQTSCKRSSADTLTPPGERLVCSGRATPLRTTDACLWQDALSWLLARDPRRTRDAMEGVASIRG
jgi:hypothetical protein